MNAFGHIFRFTSFGESHGAALGGIIDGCPAGLKLDFDAIDAEMARRRPGSAIGSTTRKEDDSVEFLSGIFEGKTTGTPIGFIIKNNNTKSTDYDNIKNTFRPSHADFTYTEKYGFRDYRGGGRSSARETACRVVAGAIAKQLLQQWGITISAAIDEVEGQKENFEEIILSAKNNLDTVGGVIKCVIKGTPTGLGEPVFDKLHARLGYAMLSINAAKGFEIGEGFNLSTMRGSAANDAFVCQEGKITTLTNHSGGIQGGISNGQDIYFRVAFKPVPTILQPQNTVDKDGNAVCLEVKGRHDACVLYRALPIVEAMAALVMVDAVLLNKNAKL